MIDSTKNLYFNALNNTNNTSNYHYCIIDDPHPEDQDNTLTGSPCLATSYRIDSFNLGTWIQKLLKPALYLLRVNFGLTVFYTCHHFYVKFSFDSFCISVWGL